MNVVTLQQERTNFFAAGLYWDSVGSFDDYGTRFHFLNVAIQHEVSNLIAKDTRGHHAALWWWQLEGARLFWHHWKGLGRHARTWWQRSGTQEPPQRQGKVLRQACALVSSVGVDCSASLLARSSRLCPWTSWAGCPVQSQAAKRPTAWRYNCQLRSAR